MTAVAQPAPAGVSTHLPMTSGPALTRVAGLPATALDLVGAPTRRRLGRALRLRAALETAAAELVAVCFDLVPRLDDDTALRRRVLAGKRAAHRLRPLPWNGADTDRIRARLDSAQHGALDDYARLQQGLADCLNLLAESLREDHASGVTRLRQAVGADGFEASLVMAAPDWVRHARPTERPPGSAKDLKTLLSYVARATVKTSPFSGLTTVGVAGDRGAGRARSRTTAALAHRALGLLAREPRTAGLLGYRPCPLRPGGPTEPTGVVLVSEVVMAEGIVWRDDRVVEADHALPWLRRLACANRDLALHEVLFALGGDAPYRRFVRLLDAGVLAVAVPWQRGDDPLVVLAELVGHLPAAVDGDLLRQAASLGRAAATQPVPERLAGAAALDRHARVVLDRSHAPSGLVFEDRETALFLPDPRCNRGVATDLRELAGLVRPFVFRSHVYDLLVERFVAEHGAGGSTRDPLGFLMRASVERDSDPMLQRAQLADLEARKSPGSRSRLPVGPTSAPPTVGVMYQVAATDEAAVAAGRHLTVVNNFGSGSGSLFARFTGLLGESFRQRLAAHVARAWQGVPCRELTVWTECNTAQAECSGVLPALVVPGEPAAVEAVRLEDCVLWHDRSSDTLALGTADGEPFGLAYLGLTPRHLLQGYLRLLSTLADPWVNGSQHCDYTPTKHALFAPLCTGEVTAVPRASHGRLVTRRASWIVPRRLLPSPDATDVEIALACAALREEHGVPEEVFVHQLGSFGSPMTGLRKPAWLSLASPMSYRVTLASLGEDTTHLRVVEALPGRDQYHQRDAAGRPVATEHCQLLTWPRDGGRPA